MDIQFLQLWQRWQRLAPPTEHYRAGAREHPAYPLEVDLDHVRTSVASVVEAFLHGRSWPFESRVREALASLQLIEFGVESSRITATQCAALVRYIQETRTLLEALLERRRGAS